MATPQEMLTAVQNGIVAVLASMASGSPIVEWSEGPVRVKKSDPAELLKTLRMLEKEYLPAADTDRSAAVGTFGGRL